MVRFAGQLLAVAALMASVVNAQCAAACGMPPLPAAPSHTCCAHQKPAKSQIPCPHPVVSGDEVLLEQTAKTTVSAPATLLGVLIAAVSPLPVRSLSPGQPKLEPPGKLLSASRSILRV